MQGYNWRRNQALAASRLFSPLLEQGVPSPLAGSVAAMLAAYSAADRTPAEMGRQTGRLLTLFQRRGYGVSDVGSGGLRVGGEVRLVWCCIQVGGSDQQGRGSFDRQKYLTFYVPV